MKLLIYNNVNFHYEIIVNVIEKYGEILKITKNSNDQLYVHCLDNISFINYIKQKYPKVIFAKITDYDYFINCTIYKPDEITINDSKHFYISHKVFNPINQISNVYHLMPKNNNNYLKCDILPFNDVKIETRIPIYVIQGTISTQRRDFSLLTAILDKTYKRDFKIKILGRGNLGAEFDKYKDKLIVRSNLDFINYHKEFADVYAILPLVSKNKNRLYYKGKLTSSINYGLAYNLKFVLDNELNNIYKINNSCEYKEGNMDSFIKQFKRSLRMFYRNRANV